MSTDFSKSSAWAVRAEQVTKFFDDVVALDKVDLNIPRGHIHGIVGPNGAGKTTLLSLVLGLAAVSEGRLEVLGLPATRVLGVPPGVNGFVDAPGLYPTLTARANLRQLARLHRLERASERISDVLEEVGLSQVADDKVRGFSLGMRQRLGLAAAMLTQPALLVMDEPSNGLDPAGRLQVHRVLSRLAQDGVAVIISSHRMDDLSQLCDEVTLLSRGHVVFNGSVDDLAAQSPSLDHRVVSDDPAAARRLAASLPGLEVVGSQRRIGDDLVVRAPQPVLDEFVRRLVSSGQALRELTPVVPPLEAAFLSLTGDLSLMDEGTATPEEDAA